MGMREKLMKLIASKHELLINLNTSIPNLFRLAEHLIANDVVPVVRCKDCKHWDIQENCDPSFMYFCNADALYAWGRPARNADDFCSYGERKDNE